MNAQSMSVQVVPKSCALSEAPGCFRFALIHSLENAAIDYSPTNWRGFADHFMLCTEGSTPGDMVHHWIDRHPNRESHTISKVLEYAEAKHHRRLEQEFERVLAEHLVDDYLEKTLPEECFRLCEKCREWQHTSPWQHVKPQSVTCHHHYGNRSVINHFYHCSASSSGHMTSSSSHMMSSDLSKDCGCGTKECLNGTIECNHSNTVDSLHKFGHMMFDTAPHRAFQSLYHGRKKELIRILFVVFFLYQCLAAVLMSMCEDGGLRAVFKTSHKYEEIMNRLLKFFLRLMVRVAIPMCCSLQIPILACKPTVPQSGLSEKEAARRLLQVHYLFSSKEETQLVKGSCEADIFRLSEAMGKRKIECIWITLLHSVLYVALLLYLGAFLVCEENTLKGGVCDFLNPTIIWIPVLQVNLHIIIALESFSIFIVAMVIGLTIDCYSYENWMGTYAVVIGGEAKLLFNEIRQRWQLMDWFSCLSPLAVGGVTLLSVSTGKPFTPYTSSNMPGSQLISWYFWITVLTALHFLGTSGNRIFKNACLCLYVLSGLLVSRVKVETSHIPYGSIMILLMTSSSAVFLNSLYCLSLSHYYHASFNHNKHSLCMFLVCVGCMVTLCVSVVVAVCHELSLFGLLYVNW